MFLSLTVCALIVEAAFGYPDTLYRRIGHPITWIGHLITVLDDALNHGGSVVRQRTCGILALIVIISVPVAITLSAQCIARKFLPDTLTFCLEILCASTLIAQKSLYDHVRAVLIGLNKNGLEGGRKAVSQIVGRNPETLDMAGVIRAAIESLAENFSDGVVAPIFWLALLGLPGAVAYKAINTADSMIGHLTARHESFGRASALCDDCVNFPASRITALWLILAALRPQYNAKAAISAVRRDARRHRSPNAGWPEAAMAGALALRLAGPRQYDDTLVADSWMGDGKTGAEPRDLARALSLYRFGCLVQGAFLLALLCGVCA